MAYLIRLNGSSGPIFLCAMSVPDKTRLGHTKLVHNNF
jgi:hypothetical protein